MAIATNMFVYYKPFEQALATTNIASMLRAGGLLLSNSDVPVPASMKPLRSVPVKYSDRQHDVIFTSQRR